MNKPELEKELNNWRKLALEAQDLLLKSLPEDKHGNGLITLIRELIFERDFYKKSIEFPQQIKLPDTRKSFTKKVIVANWDCYITVGFYPNMQPGEVFIVIAKEGTTISGFADSAAQLASILLQRGVPWNEIKTKWEYSRFEPSDENYSSLLDAFAKTVSELIKLAGGDESVGNK